MSTNIFAFIIVLGILIFFHELGHFLVARLCGVGVEKFSLGFGPRILGKTVGITDYRISAIPLGGYVKMVGDEPDAEIDPEMIPLSFTHKNVYKKILIVAAGPIFNLLLAILIFFAIFIISGTYILKPTIGEVKENTPAFSAGLKKGDMIVAINGQSIGSWDEMAGIITQGKGNPLSITINRGDRMIDMEITPGLTIAKNIFGEDIERFVIGISAAGDVYSKELSVVESAKESIGQTYNITKLTVISIVKLIQGTVSAKTLGGPIMIAEMAGKQAKEGAANFVFFIALLSINLAVLNFLPIPVLDGGHLFFFFIEVVIRKPVNTKIREIAQQAGIFILILLMIYVFYNDITRIFFS